MLERIKNVNSWEVPEITEQIPQGDMPGDQVCIGEDHVKKAKLIFEELLRILPDVMDPQKNRVVLAVCGGSGVGKSETASLLSYFFQQMGIGSYTLSGDNYPRRIPKYNDAERLRVFRLGGVRALMESGEMNPQVVSELIALQKQDDDANKEYSNTYPWFETYLEGAVKALGEYLGTKNEIDFDEVTKIVSQFKDGADKIWLKRMGRTESDLWYEEVDFSNVNVLVIEWTHGNSDCYEGVDIPILLNSTPEETLAHRRSRNRDGKTDSPFTMRVLEVEQQMLDAQAHKAKIIVSKDGELLSFEEYTRRMHP